MRKIIIAGLQEAKLKGGNTNELGKMYKLLYSSAYSAKNEMGIVIG